MNCREFTEFLDAYFSGELPDAKLARCLRRASRRLPGLPRSPFAILSHDGAHEPSGPGDGTDARGCAGGFGAGDSGGEGEVGPACRAGPHGGPARQAGPTQISFVVPGAGTGGVSSLVSQVKSCGNVSSFEFNACSHVTGLPVYADMRPMMAVSVLSATCLSSFTILPPRMLSIRSACSRTYGLTSALSLCANRPICWRCHSR